MSAAPDLPFYTLKKLAEMTGFSRAHLYNERTKGRLVMSKLAGRTVVMSDDLKAWIGTAEPYQDGAASSH